MLDDLKMIHERDSSDALGLAAKQWQELEHIYDIDLKPGDYQNVLLAGMGGSALAAEISRSWPGWKVPFVICRDYSIPDFAGPKTLFIASSYSGNTEETIAALAEAEQKGCQIVVMASGGRLEGIAKEKHYPLTALPKISKPRYGVLYGLKALVTIGEKAGLVVADKAFEQLKADEAKLRAAIADWQPDVPVSKNYAKELALELLGRTVVVYAGPKLYPAAFKWKISFNENSKNVAFSYAFSEFNHNEFTGWTSHPVEKPFGVIYLLSTLEHERIQKRFALTEKLLSGRWPAPIHVNVVGDTLIQQLLWAVALGDMVSIYLALLNGVDPIDPPGKDLIETFKQQLG